MVEKADRREKRYLERSKNIKINLKITNQKLEVMEENNVGSDENQVNNEELSLDKNVETMFSEPTESIPSKVIESDSNLKVNKDEIAMNKQFAEQLSFYRNIKPSCENINISKVETSEENSQFNSQEAVADVETVEKHINKKDACSDENVKTSSDFSELKETVSSKVVESDLNLNSKTDKVAMNETFANQLSIYKKVHPSYETKSVEKPNERKSITFSLVNDDLLKKYFKDDSEIQTKESVSDSIDDSAIKESTISKCSNKSDKESSLNILSVTSNDTGHNLNSDNHSKSCDNSDNDDVSKKSSLNNVEKSKDSFITEVGIKFSSDDIKWNLDSLSNEG